MNRMKLPPPLDWPIAGIGPDADVPPELRVTRDNWRTYPYSRWAFQHARELVPSRVIRRSSTPRELEEAWRDLSGISFPDAEGRLVRWDEFLERTYTDAFLVLHRGALVYEHYANGMTAETPHLLFSITKSFFGLLAEILIVQGVLDPDSAVEQHVPELGASGFAGCTVRQILDMTDGVAFDENYADPDAEVHRYSAAYWTPQAGFGGVFEALKGLTRRAAPPGAQFRYRTPVADVLGWILLRATGQSLTKLLGDRIWRPAGCADNAQILLDTAGHEIAGAGLNATARDLARVALMLLDGGWVDDRLVIPPVALDNIAIGGDRGLFDASGFPTRPGGSYRSQWWVNHEGYGSLSALGVFGQRLYLEPGSGLAVIRTGSHPVASNSFTDVIHANAFDAIREALA
ncbi:class A beta-lactamase-related serine hydrolase [Sphingomonas cavernae]|uniref:Class A beta-lactamase-related serine hydrolase n=2 Tax=Sphingomonas cavernae TaxID=2320861 RepID=A0A418WQE3_9SPHN|nr:class A beta-lactamase-related serine hydrolase [Sphingomonas cavernae]